MGVSVGIGGVSRAGKTTLSNFLRNKYPELKTLIVSMDKYVHNSESIPKIKGKVDWETPVSVDFDRIHKTITDNIDQYDLIITEGILIFYDERVDALFDRRIFIDIPVDLFYQRRHEEERWGNEPEWYIDYVWESYLKYGQLDEKATHTLYIKGDEPFENMDFDKHLFGKDSNSKILRKDQLSA